MRPPQQENFQLEVTRKGRTPGNPGAKWGGIATEPQGDWLRRGTGGCKTQEVLGRFQATQDSFLKGDTTASTIDIGFIYP